MAPKEEANKKDGTVTVNIEDFTRTRDSVLVSLAQLNSAVADLSRAYINHANTALGRNPADLDLGIINSDINNALYDHGLITRFGSPGGKSEAGDKRKGRRARDPNAPKRALTPYFLYMQHNRPHIAADLGDGAKPKDVAEEGTKRWQAMPEAQKTVWKQLYSDNLATYREKMNQYKEKKEQEKGQETDHAASSQLQQDVATAEGSEESESEPEQEESAAEASPTPEPPKKEPSPPRSSNKRRRSEGTTKSTPKAAAAEEPSSTAKSPEKKKRGPASKKDKEKEKEDETPASTRKNAGAEPKRSRKKRKSEAGGEE